MQECNVRLVDWFSKAGYMQLPLELLNVRRHPWNVFLSPCFHMHFKFLHGGEKGRYVNSSILWEFGYTTSVKSRCSWQENVFGKKHFAFVQSSKCVNIKSGSLEVDSAGGMVTYVDVESQIGLMEKESGESQTKTKSCGHVCRRRTETHLHFPQLKLHVVLPPL